MQVVPRDSDLVKCIPFDDIVAGATVRFTIIDGKQYLSIRDIIMHVCDKDKDQAGAVWRTLSDLKKNEVREFLSNFQFPGRGQQDQPVITFPGAIKLLMFLPGEKAKTHRSTMVSILTRYFAGDPSLLNEIITNGEAAPTSKSISVTQVARELGYNLNHANQIKVGRLVATKYRAKYDAEPPTHTQWVDGAERPVKSYTEADRGLIVEALAELGFGSRD